MKILINQNSFIKAVEYASANFFSKPYSITQMVDRWFNQLAMIETSNGKIIHLTDKVARNHVDIKLGGSIVPKEDIELIFKFHSKNANFEKEREELSKKIAAAKKKLSETKDIPPNKKLIASLKEELELKEKKLKLFDDDKIKAQGLYEAIVKDGEISLNRDSPEADIGKKIKNIVYRPNHGLTHSVRVANSITTLCTYYRQFGIEFEQIKEKELEKLQLMMLFSVVGRLDETGFKDGATGQKTYEGFRATSGREYLKYCKDNAKRLYSSDVLEDLFRDAIVVELMGYSDINDAISRGAHPELLLDYVIQKKVHEGLTLTRDEAKALIDRGDYSLAKLYSIGVREKANKMLGFMNDAHALDLSRCYPLYPNTVHGPKSVLNLSYFLNKCQFFNFSDIPDSDKLTSFFKLMRYSFDALDATGQQSTFGMLSSEAFEEQKESMLAEIKRISDDFNKPEKRDDLLRAAIEANDADEIKNYFTHVHAHSQDTTEQNICLSAYRNYLITKYIAECLKVGKQLSSDVRMFDFNQSIGSDLAQRDHFANAASVVKALESIPNYPGIIAVELPIISKVEHLSDKKIAVLFFNESKQAEIFKKLYKDMFGADVQIEMNTEGLFSIAANEEHYSRLKKSRLVEFKLVTIPRELSREADLISDDGSLEALHLLSKSRGLGRLVSTTPLGKGSQPDYYYLGDALEDPVHQRYAAPLKNIGEWTTDRTRYQDPRTGKYYTRRIASGLDLKYQEPIIKPSSFDPELTADWTVHKERGSDKNSIYTKKLACALIKPYREDELKDKGKPFEGYLATAHRYEGIGFLFDVNSVDLKDGRYLWSQNMVTWTRFWLRDTAMMDKKILDLLNVKYDKGLIVRDLSGKAVNDIDIDLFKSNFKDDKSIERYLSNINKRADDLVKCLNNSNYRPSDDNLKVFADLIKREKVQFLTYCPKDKQREEIIIAYDKMLGRVNEELERKDKKYSTTLDNLQELLKTSGSDGHTELLAGLTKSALRALYASKDELFDRLNLVFHAMKMKEKYHYDVPLVVMSVDKPPYHYTEEMIRADLLKAYTEIKAATFPYDRRHHLVYELDQQGSVIVDAAGNPKVQKDKQGREMSQPHNIKYQEDLLVNLFKLGLPELASIDELGAGAIGGVAIDQQTLETAISSITERMDLVGGILREKKLMGKVFASDSVKEREALLLRSAALGHQPIIDTLKTRVDFIISDSLLEKAILFAKQNQHLEVQASLVDWQAQIAHEKVEIAESLAKLNGKIMAYATPQDIAKYHHALGKLNECIKRLGNNEIDLAKRGIALKMLEITDSMKNQLLIATSTKGLIPMKELTASLDAITTIFDSNSADMLPCLDQIERLATYTKTPDKKTSPARKLSGLLIMAIGITLIAASVALLAVSFGLSTGLSAVGFVIGAKLAISAGIAQGLLFGAGVGGIGATLTSIGLFKNFNKKSVKEQKVKEQPSTTAETELDLKFKALKSDVVGLSTKLSTESDKTSGSKKSGSD